MKFSCDTCHTKYSIADEKVRGKILKIRCKKCQNIIVLRETRRSELSGVGAGARPKTAADSAQSGRPTPALQPSPARTAPRQTTAAQARHEAARQEARTQAARVSASSQFSPAQDPDDDATQVASFDSIQRMLGTNVAPALAVTQNSTAVEDDGLVWYTAVRGQQSPPMRRRDIARQIRNGDLNAQAYAWNETLANWTRLAELPQFSDDLKWRHEQERGGNVVDFRQKVAERKRQDAPVQRTPAISALEQIADLVRDPMLDSSPKTGAKTPQRSFGSGVTAGQQRPEASYTGDRSSGVSVAATRPPSQAVQATTKPSAFSAQHAAKVSPTAPTGETEDFFFNSASIESFVGEPIARNEELAPMAKNALGMNATPFDPFSLVPDATPQFELPHRETTRVFMARAGLANRARKHKIYAIVGLSVGLIVVSSIALDAIGVIRIPILHTYVESVKVATVGDKDEAAHKQTVNWDDVSNLTDEERAVIREALLNGNYKKAAEVQRKATKRKQAVGGGANNIDMSGQQNSSAQGDNDMKRRGEGSQLAVELSVDQKAALESLSSLSKGSVRIQSIKPELGEIKFPERHAGGLAPKQIADVVVENQRSVGRCADQWSKSGDSLPPALNVTAVILNSGKVGSAVINELQFRNLSLGQCLRRAVLNWRFPEFTGDTMEIEIPFKFTTVQ